MLDRPVQVREHKTILPTSGSEFSDFRWLAGDAAVVRYQ